MKTQKNLQAALATVALTSLCWSCGVSERSDSLDSTVPADSLSESKALQLQLESLLDQSILPGIVVALAEGDREPLLAAAGYADTVRMTPLQPETPFFIGSISKNVFAVIALQLAEEGRLGLDDPLSAFIEWPRGDEITIRMLMNHTSGVPDYFSDLSLLDSENGVPEFFSVPHSPPDIIRMLPSRDPSFAPGSQQSYSNTNGLLVGQVIEKVTGKTLGEVFDERIASRLGLQNSYLYDETMIGRFRARGYCGMPGWGATPEQLVDCSFADEALPNSADGSLVMSAEDLLRYHRALRGGELLGANSWQTMRHVEPGLDNGLGYLIMTGPLGPLEGNIGRAIGHLSASVYYLDRDLFVVMMLNRGDAPLPIHELLNLRYGLAPRRRIQSDH